jgi:hypothetical protein
MDVLAHTLWAGAGARAANAMVSEKDKKFRVSVSWTAWWGVFPDLFAFGIPFAVRFYNILFGSNPISSFFMRPPQAGVEESLNGFGLAHTLYQYSHSLVIWAVVFGIVWAFYKRPRYELLGWALHILIDIPSHSLAFFPTPFLFPISNYKFPYGIPWSNKWFMIINYSALLLVWLKVLFSKKG